MTETKEMTKTQSKALAELYAETGIEERAGEGQVGLTQDDYAMPFLALLQSGSPQVKKTDSRCVEGAEEGMFFNTVDKTFFKDGVPEFIPCAYRRSMVEWKLREDGGGYVGESIPGTEPKTITDDKNRDILENGNELKDTRYWYGIIVQRDAEGEIATADPAVIGMTRTQLKPSKAWVNLTAKNIWPDGVTRAKSPPLYVWSYSLKSIPQQKDEFSFWNFEVARGIPVTDAGLLRVAMNLHDSVKSGDIRRADETVAETEATDSKASTDESSGKNY